MLEKILFPFWFLVTTIISLIALVAWFYSVYTHATASAWLYALVTFFIPPIGVIDGIGRFLGFW